MRLFPTMICDNRNWLYSNSSALSPDHSSLIIIYREEKVDSHASVQNPNLSQQMAVKEYASTKLLAHVPVAASKGKYRYYNPKPKVVFSTIEHSFSAMFLFMRSEIKIVFSHFMKHM